MKKLVLAASAALAVTGCATITNDPNQPVAFKAPGCAKDTLECTARNKRGSWSFKPPATVPIRRSDDLLQIECTTAEGDRHQESIPSRMGGKVVASAIFLDFGITDAITDKHREYPAQIVLSACSG